MSIVHCDPFEPLTRFEGFSVSASDKSTHWCISIQNECNGEKINMLNFECCLIQIAKILVDDTNQKPKVTERLKFKHLKWSKSNNF